MRRSTLSNFDHLLKYKSPLKSKTFRSTQIICTIDVESDEEKLFKMIAAGMNIACFDCSQAPAEAFESAINNLRNALKKYNHQRKNARMSGDGEDNVEKCFDVSIATAFNIKAQSFMTGNPMNNEKFFLQPSRTVNVTNNKDYIDYCDANWIYINYPKLTELTVQQIIYIGEKMKLMVEDVNASEAFACCRILKGGYSEDNPMEVLIPGVKLNFPNVNKEFIDTIEFAKRNHVDMIFVAISDHFAFETTKCRLKMENQEHSIALVAKIENQASYDNIDKFIEHADGILISRYRMGLNMSSEKAVAAQKCIIAKCLKAGIPSIVSSQMLKIMSESGNEPTSAEISDIFNATIDGCDCTMLDTDSIQSIQKMQDTLLESEQMINHRKWFSDLLVQVPVPSDTSNSIAVSACMSALVSNASAIIVLTLCGKIARLIAKYRPECPIIVVTPNDSVARRCLLLHGVSSICIKDQSDNYLENVENSIESGLQFIHQSCMIAKYPTIVVAVYTQKEGLACTDTMQIINVSSKPDRTSINISHGSDGDDGTEIS